MSSGIDKIVLKLVSTAMVYKEVEQGSEAPSFVLVPLNSPAVQVAKHIKNELYQVPVDNDTVGLCVSFDDPEKQYITLGRRGCDIFLPEHLSGSKKGAEISDFQAAFHVVEETGAVLLTDRSTRKNTEIVPKEQAYSIPFRDFRYFREHRRSMVVCIGINPRISFGHDHRYLFELKWRSDGLYDFPNKTEPYLLGPRKSKSKKYIQGNKIGGGAHSSVYLAIDVSTGDKIAVKKFHSISRKNLEFATREVKNLLGLKELNLEYRVSAFLSRLFILQSFLDT